MNKLTLEDLVQKGVKRHNARIEAQRRARAEEEARLQAQRAEAERDIIALFPAPLHPFMVFKFPDGKPKYANVIVFLPGGGEIQAYTERTPNGWATLSQDDYYRARQIAVYDSKNPQGYFSRFFSIEEAVAYAMGAIA